MNYSNGKIYQILCLETDERYIGSCTTTLAQRLYGHTQKNNRCSSRQIIERGNYKMSLLEECPCSNRKELNTRERYHFLKLENVNIRRPVRLKEDEHAIANETKEYQTEYKLANREKISDMGKEYRDTHRDQRREYEAINREQITERRRQYHIVNKEVNNLKSREYRQANLEMVRAKERERDRVRDRAGSDKHECDCGGRYTTRTKLKHTYSHKHREYANVILKSETVD